MIFNNGNKRIALKDVEFHHCNFLYEKYKHSVVEIVFNNDDGVCMNGRDCHNLCPFPIKVIQKELNWQRSWKMI